LDNFKIKNKDEKYVLKIKGYISKKKSKIKNVKIEKKTEK
jgi:hypothetical protein